jgi:hypothetical protein
LPSRSRRKVTRTEDPKPEVKPVRSVFGGTYTPWQPTTYTYTATGLLTVQMTETEGLGLRRSFSDGKRQRLEDLLGPFISHLGTVAAAIKADRAERECIAAERAAEAARRKEEEKRRRIEKQRLEAVIAEAEAWHRAEKLRAYAWEAVQRLKLSHPSDQECLRRREDLNRLLDYADRLDPLKRDDHD